MFKRLSASSNRWRMASLFAFTTLIGLQLLRALFPLLLYVLRDRFGWSAVQIGILALGLFLLTYLVAPFSRWLGARRLLVAAVLLMGLARLFIQWWTADPLWDLLAALVGVLAWGLALPLLVGWLGREAQLIPGLALGMLGGLALDLGLHGLYGTYDMHWQTDWLTAVFVTLFVFIQLLLLFFNLRAYPHDPVDPGAGSFAWLAVTPLLFLYLLTSGNLATLQTSSSWSPPLALFLLLLAHLLGLSLFFWPSAVLRGVVLAGAALLLVWLAGVGLLGWSVTGWVTAVITLCTQPILAGLWLLALQRLRPGTNQRTLRRLSAANGTALVLLAIFLFAYYASYDLRFPFSRDILPLVAFLLLLTTALPRLRRPATQETAVWRLWASAFVVLLIFPLVLWQSYQTPTDTAVNGRALRVMTYNLHNGFDPEGDLDLETLARTIELAQVDVVGLQEVSRGWLINGSVDMLTWLARRLDMNYVFAPTAGPLWGNALLTRLPILGSETVPLPPDDLLLARGVLAVTVDTGEGTTLTVLTTHYHHLLADSDIRVQQSAAILAQWPAATRTVLLGDMNSTPESAEMMRLQASGWQDALAVHGVTASFTYPSTGPTRQIDYIWVSPDLLVGETAVLPDTGSDHLPIVTSIE
ncbi:MAG: endonuclease/exonuclease/phosphatase family protein [Ardenticatenaceae bacterium]|nr:endonuclease/exonuclease/phosphatase family protein [Ardenticatenaceae bacterium]